MSSGTPSAPSATARASCSRKSALPSARARTLAASSGLRACRCASSSAAVPGASLPRRSAIFARSGRSSKRSSRAVPTRSTGAASVSSRNSSMSRSVGSAQCRSSNTTTSGRFAESEASSRATASNDSSRLSTPGPCPGQTQQPPGDRRCVCPAVEQLGVLPLSGDRRELLEQLSQRAVGVPAAVARARAGQRAALGQLRDQLGNQPRLADARLSADEHEPGVPLPRDALELRLEHRKLLLASDEVGCGVRQPGRTLDRTEQAPRRQRSALAACGGRRHGARPHRARDEPVGQLAQQDAADGRGLLEASRGVDRVPGGERLTARGITRDDLAGVHADPHGQVHPELDTKICAQLGDAGSQVERSPNRPESIVFVGRREAEDAHHRVSDVLLHLPAVSPQGARRSLEVARLDVPQHFRIEALPERGRTDEIAEDDRDQRPPLTRRRLAERESAAGAEARVVRREVAARRAGTEPTHRVVDRTP